MEGLRHDIYSTVHEYCGAQNYKTVGSKEKIMNLRPDKNTSSGFILTG